MFKSTLLMLTMIISLSSFAECWEWKPFEQREQVEDLDPFEQSSIDWINSIQTTWQAGKNFDENQFTLEDLIIMSSGVSGVSFNDSSLNTEDENNCDNIDGSNLPDEYDPRKKYPKCVTIQSIYDQGQKCGACWTFAPTSSLNDRYCIKTNQKQQNLQTSAFDALACAKGHGCDGGNPLEAWNYFQNKGVCTGGQYLTHETCKPYPFPPTKIKQQITETSNIQDKVPCTDECSEKKYQKKYADDKWYAKDIVSHYTDKKLDENMLKKELLENGPISTVMLVYKDFFNYKSGVYQHHARRPVGVHAIKLLGWGVEKNVPYWLVANSWGPRWGDNGFFKILRGKNECSFEQYVQWGKPKV